jgi:hypothetical protein
MHIRISLALTAGLMIGSLPHAAVAQTAFFDQPTDTIALTGNTTLGDAYTIEAYVYATATTAASEGRIYAEQLDAQEDKALAANGGGTIGVVWNNNCDASRASGNPLSLGSWHHVAFMRVAGTYNLFIDGVRVDQRPATCAGRNTAGSRMSVGAFRYIFGNDLHESFIGYMDWVRISSIARYAQGGFSTPTAEPLVDANTLVLLTFNDPAGTTTPVVQGSGLLSATVASGFAGATSPQFGTGPCDSIDFNNDGSSFDPTDIDAFLSVFSEGPCIPAAATCNDVDFNNDGSLFDPCDIDSFLLVFSEGPCTLCGV